MNGCHGGACKACARAAATKGGALPTLICGTELRNLWIGIAFRASGFNHIRVVPRMRNATAWPATRPNNRETWLLTDAKTNEPISVRVETKQSSVESRLKVSIFRPKRPFFGTRTAFSGALFVRFEPPVPKPQGAVPHRQYTRLQAAQGHLWGLCPSHP